MWLNPLRNMLILGSSISAANKDMRAKKKDKWGYNYLILSLNIFILHRLRNKFYNLY